MKKLLCVSPRPLRFTAFNSAPHALCVAANAQPLAPLGADAPSEEWHLLAPYGDHPLQLELAPGKWRGFIQRLDAAQAGVMVAAFNSLRAKAARLIFRGPPIQIGHPRMDPRRWPDDSRIGSVVDMEARADGLYVKTAWNSKGMENRREGYHPYPSAEWDYDVNEALKTGIILPAVLSGVGMVNFPNINDVTPWTNSAPLPAPAYEPIAKDGTRSALVKRLSARK